jgi:LuxR family maltose regulon positive regulatory protein
MGEPQHIARPRLLARLDEPSRITVVRAPVGFGKSVLVGQWLEATARPGRLVATVSISFATHTAEDFWGDVQRAVESVMIDSDGLPADGASTAPEASRATRRRHVSPAAIGEFLRKLTHDLVLVIDAFERGPQVGISADLVNLVADCPRLQVLVIGRSSHGIEHVAARRLPVVVIDAPDLQFTAEETAEVFRAVDRVMPSDRVAAVYKEFRGWPLPTDGVARSCTGEGNLPSTRRAMEAVVEELRAEMVPEMTAGEFFSRVGSLAMVEPLTAATAEVVLADLDGPGRSSVEQGLFEGLVSHGLVVPMAFANAPGSAHATYEWVPVVRRLVRDYFVRSNPDRARELDERLARWYRAQAEPTPAIAHATWAASWDLVVDIIDESLLALLGDGIPELINALSAIPREALGRSALATATRSVGLQRREDPGAMPHPELLDADAIDALGRSAEARHAIDMYAMVSAMYRRQGFYAEALAYSRQVEAIVRTAEVVQMPQVAGALSVALGHSAVLFAALGCNHAAIERLNRAYKFASASDLVFSDADVSGTLAMTYALMGDVHHARIWAEREAEATAAVGPIERIIGGRGMLARALIALGDLDPDACLAALDYLEDSVVQDEWSARALEAHSIYALLWGDRQSMLDEVIKMRERFEATEDRDTTGGIAPIVLASAEANLLISLGRGNQAEAALNAMARSHPLLEIARVRLTLLAGDHERALELSRASSQVSRAAAGRRESGVAAPPIEMGLAQLSDAAEFSYTAPGYGVEMLLIQAVACHRLGTVPEAGDALRRAARRANELESYLPFATVPRAELLAIAEHVPEAAAILSRRELVNAPEMFPTTIALVVLSSRERLVLNELALGRPVREIATRLFVSINTVKTQLRSLYRKLGAASREQALSMATELNLITMNHELAEADAS